MGCLVDLGLYGDALQVVEDPRTDMSDAQRALWRVGSSGATAKRRMLLPSWMKRTTGV